MMHRAGAGLVILAVLVLAGFPGRASGSPTHAEGKQVLGPYLGGGDYADAYLSSLGLVLHPGDTLHFAWSVNGGSGPDVYFEIHAHPPPTGLVRYWWVNSSAADGAWTVPGSYSYMVFWRNLFNVWENVTYTYDVTPGASAYTLPIEAGLFAVLVGLPVAIVAIRWRRRVRAHAGRRPGSKETLPANQYHGSK